MFAPFAFFIAADMRLGTFLNNTPLSEENYVIVFPADIHYFGTRRSRWGE